VRAAHFFGGVTRQWLFDNPKTVVLARHGDAVRYHPGLLEISGALRVQPMLCRPRRPTDKGLVERANRFLHDRFFAARAMSGIEVTAKYDCSTAATSLQDTTDVGENTSASKTTRIGASCSSKQVRRAVGTPMPVALELSAHVHDCHVTPHDLSDYDRPRSTHQPSSRTHEHSYHDQSCV
jgi:hypothetical protein